MTNFVRFSIDGAGIGVETAPLMQLRLQPTNVAPAFDRFPSAFAAGYIGKIKLFSSQIILFSMIPNIFLKILVQFIHKSGKLLIM